MPYCYEYPRPALTTDCFIYCLERGIIWILLIQRKNPPFTNLWAMPGGFVDDNELLIDAAKRELKEETGLDGITLQQLKAFDNPGRDPRGRTISIIFWGFAGNTRLPLNPDSDAKDSGWFDINRLPELAFDHDEIVRYARNTLTI